MEFAGENACKISQKCLQKFPENALKSAAKLPAKRPTKMSAKFLLNCPYKCLIMPGKMCAKCLQNAP
jgi:hypothetical protein